MDIILSRIMSLFLSFLLALSGIFPGLAGEVTEIAPEDVTVVENEYLDSSYDWNSLENTVIKSKADWDNISAKIKYADLPCFDEEFFKNNSLAVHTAFKSSAGYELRVVSAVQNRFTVLVHYELCETSIFQTTDIAPAFMLVPVADTVVSANFVSDGERKAGEFEKFSVEDAVVIDDLNYLYNWESLKNTVIQSETKWKTLAAMIDNSDKLGFDSEFFKNNSLAVHTATKSSGMNTMKITSGTQNNFAAEIHYAQYEASGIVITDAPTVLLLVPVAKTVFTAKFVYDGSFTPEEIEELPANFANTVPLDSDSEWENYSPEIYYSYEKWAEDFGDNEDVMNLGYDEAYFEEGALSVAVIRHPSSGWSARVDYIARKSFELHIFYTAVTEEEVHLDVLEYELIAVPVDKEVVTMNVRCIGEEYPGVQDFYAVYFRNALPQFLNAKVYGNYESWTLASEGVAELEELGFDEEFFETYSLAATVVTYPATNYWSELYSVNENEGCAKIKYLEVYAGDGGAMLSYELILVPVSKNITEAEFESLGEFNKYDLLFEQ